MCKLKLWNAERRWLRSLTELICWEWCQRPLQNLFKVINGPKLKSLPQLVLNYKAGENIRILLLGVNVCTWCCVWEPFRGRSCLFINTKRITSLPVDMQTQSAVSHKTDGNLWGIMKAKSDSLWRKLGGKRKTTWMTTCQHERLPLLTLLQARNGN